MFYGDQFIVVVVVELNALPRLNQMPISSDGTREDLQVVGAFNLVANLMVYCDQDFW